jgi:hypothetical protein
LLVGDSFAAGSGVSDEQSLGQELARISRLPVYNAAPNNITAPDDLRMDCGLVIWLESERAPLPSPLLLSTFGKPPDIGWKGRVIRGFIGDRGRERTRSLLNYLEPWWSYSPMQIWSARALKLIQNDKFFPNTYRRLVESRTLPNGKEMLFLPDEIQHYNQDRSTDPSFFVELQSRLKEKGIGLLVVLVPDKYVVYHDLLSPTSKTRRPFTDVVAERLSAANVPVVNLTEPFRAEAPVLLAHDSYLYWLDDTHWNATGIHDAAIEIVKSDTFPRQLPCSTGSGSVDIGGQ